MLTINIMLKIKLLFTPPPRPAIIPIFLLFTDNRIPMKKYLYTLSPTSLPSFSLEATPIRHSHPQPSSKTLLQVASKLHLAQPHAGSQKDSPLSLLHTDLHRELVSSSDMLFIWDTAHSCFSCSSLASCPRVLEL